MKLVIKELIPSTKTPDSYEVVITTMSGDADGYEKIILGPFIKDKDEPSIKLLLKTLRELKSSYPQGRGGGPEYGYDNIKNFLLWFGGYDEYGDRVTQMTEEEFTNTKATMSYSKYETFIKRFSAEWPNDVTTDYQSENSYSSHEFFYYDENQNKFRVELKE